MKHILLSTAATMFATTASAGGLGPPIIMEPPILTPPSQFSWSGGYGGLSYGQSNHTRDYTRNITEDRDIHNYQCDRGTKPHLMYKCDVGNFVDAAELAALDNVFRPWNNARDQDVRYNNGYEGFWMGASETFSFSVGDQRDLGPNQKGWAQVSYLGYDTVTEIVGSEQYSTTTQDTTVGGFVGYNFEVYGPLFAGVEANFFQAQDLDETFAQIEGRGCLATGRVLSCVGAGDDLLTITADLAITDNLIVGARQWQSDDDEGTQIRIGWKF